MKCVVEMGAGHITCVLDFINGIRLALAMVHNIQNYCVRLLCLSPGIVSKYRKHDLETGSQDGDRSNFRNVVFSSYLEFQTMNKSKKPGDFRETYKI
jgi:hypothetical protein